MSEVQDRVKVLLEWCAANSIFIDSQIRVGSNSQAGIGVFSEDCFIPPQTTLVRIRKDSVLSVRTCSLAGVIPSNPYGLAAQLSLSLALHVEILKGRQSRWHGYLQSLPVGVMDLPLFWDLHTDANENEDGSGALTWLRGTEARKIIFGRTENGATKLEEVTCFYYDVAKPLLLHYTEVWRQDASTRMPTLLDFYRAFSLVSSRAFLVDAYHGLSMVPIADAFNHVLENHVHLESDYNVCPECGSLHECPHDRDEDTADEARAPQIPKIQDDDHNLFYEMVSNSGIPPLTEIFNTYGEELTNAELLNQYGFILDVNDNDRLSWTLDEIIHILSPGAYTENSLQSLVVDIRRVISCLPEGHSVFSDSQLIYHEASAEEKFCLSEEGTMSHQLWAVLFGLSFRRNLSRSPEIDISRTLHAVLDLQTRAENLDGNDEDDSDTDDRDDRYPTETLDQPDQMALKLLLDVCQLAVKLCTMRKANSGREEFGGMGLSDVMEEIPDSSIRTRLAISLLMGERSVLDCCEAAWMALLSSATRLLEGFAPAPLFGIS